MKFLQTYGFETSKVRACGTGSAVLPVLSSLVANNFPIVIRAVKIIDRHRTA